MISIKTSDEIQNMREGGKILAHVLSMLQERARAGTNLKELDTFAEREIVNAEAQPSFKGYRGYPASTCLSVNDEVVHGLPRDYALKDGDILSIDVGVYFRGFHTDAAVTVPVGAVSKKAATLIEATQEALERGLEAVRPGTHLGDIGSTIQHFIEGRGLSIVRDLVGHGVGKELQEEPQIPNFGKKGTGPELVEGMTIAIEPMVTAGDFRVELAVDGFTYKTVDGSLAAHFEHTVAVVADGAFVLTQQ